MYTVDHPFSMSCFQNANVALWAILELETAYNNFSGTNERVTFIDTTWKKLYNTSLTRSNQNPFIVICATFDTEEDYLYFKLKWG